MAIGKNIVANITGRIWGIISIYVFVPIYIKLLGIESYGVISFYTLLLTVLAFADAGLTATLNREFAKAGDDDLAYKQNLLRTFEYVYLVIGVIVIGGIFFGAESIVTHFVKSEMIPFNELVWHIRIMGAIIALYLVSSLYNGGLMGLQKQVLSNVLMIVYGVVRSGLVIIPLIWLPYLDLYFYWQLGVAVIYFFVLRYYLNRSVRIDAPVQANFSYFRNIWKYALGMMIMAVIYSVNTQVDKLSISSLLSLKHFTYYSLAAMVGQGVLVLAVPIGMAFFPELTRLVSIKDEVRAKTFYHKFAYIIASLTSALAVILVFYAYDYILIWTGDAVIAQAIATTTVLLTLGAMFMSVQLCPYYLALANGYTKANVIMGILSIICIIPSLQLLIPRYGLLGAAIPWFVINFTVTALLGYIVMKKFMRGEFQKWFLIDSFIPILVSFFVGGAIYLLFGLLPAGIYTILYGIVILVAITAVNAYICSRRYPEILQNPIITRFIKKKNGTTVINCNTDKK